MKVLAKRAISAISRRPDSRVRAMSVSTGPMRWRGLVSRGSEARATCKYYAMSFGQRLLLAGLKLKEHLLLPALSAA